MKLKCLRLLWPRTCGTMEMNMIYVCIFGTDGFRSSMIRAAASGTVGQRMMFDNFLLERKQFFEDLVCKGSYRNQCK